MAFPVLGVPQFHGHQLTGAGGIMAIVTVGIDLAKNASQGYVEKRSALINCIRGLLSELGIVLPLKAGTEVGAAGDFEAR